MSFLLWLGSKLEISALLLFKVIYFKQKNQKTATVTFLKNNRWLSLLTNIKYSYARAWEIGYISQWNGDCLFKKDFRFAVLL